MIRRHDLILPLRGFAALAVLFFHSFGHLDGQSVWAPMEPIRTLCGYGWLGIHVFFVISGYSMFVKMNSLVASGRGAKDFLKDRFFRIMPAYWAALVFTILLGLLASFFNTSGIAGAIPSTWTSALADLLLIQPYCETQSLLLVSWTLTVEWGFYLICALLLVAGRNAIGSTGIFLCILILGAACLWPGIPFASIVFNNWPAFCLGVLAAAIHSDKPLGPRTAAGLLLLLFFCFKMQFTNPSQFLTELATTLLLLLPSNLHFILKRIPGFALLEMAGLFSFSIYLIHAPVLSRLANLSSRYTSTSSPFLFCFWAASVAFTLLICVAFYKTVEANLEKKRKAASPRRTDP